MKTYYITGSFTINGQLWKKISKEDLDELIENASYLPSFSFAFGNGQMDSYVQNLPGDPKFFSGESSGSVSRNILSLSFEGCIKVPCSDQTEAEVFGPAVQNKTKVFIHNFSRVNTGTVVSMIATYVLEICDPSGKAIKVCPVSGVVSDKKPKGFNFPR